VQSILDN